MGVSLRTPITEHRTPKTEQGIDVAITDDPGLMRLLTKIHDEKGIDFTQHKEKSLCRRLESCMRRRSARSFDEYVKVLEGSPEEYNSLLNALTINVTDFFRNPESFEAISKIVIPRVIFSKREHQHRIIRAWSCGCSSGDEPYTLAMLLLEKLGKAGDGFFPAVIGSDIDKEALSEARSMVYSRQRLKAVDRKLLDGYFEKVDGDAFRLSSAVSGLVRFRHNDIIKDRPFTHCDIILCGNLLIYFNKQLQEEVLLKFYECLNPGGFLVLDMVESLTGAAINAFEHVNNRLRIYRRPEKESMKYETRKVLIQEDIDKIVNDMLEKG